MKSFVTGSRAYGFPREDSDLDLVVLVSKQDAETLCQMFDGKKAPNDQGWSIHVGKLNIVAFTDDDDGRDLYRRWEAVTRDLAANGPVTRDEAIREFKKWKIGSNMSQG